MVSTTLSRWPMAVKAKDLKQISIIFSATCFIAIFPISVTEAERRRLQDAFRRLSSPGANSVSRNVFLREILGDGVPASIADRIFSICGGGLTPAAASNGQTTASSFTLGSQSRGLAFRDILTVLVLLTRGSYEEKTKCEKPFFVFTNSSKRILSCWLIDQFSWFLVAPWMLQLFHFWCTTNRNYPKSHFSLIGNW